MQEFLYKLQLARGDMLITGPTGSEQAVVAEHFASPGLQPAGRDRFSGPHAEY
jgi:hypothetical protein